MLSDVVAFLTCPVCGGGLEVDAHALRCHRGHSFDVAKQGYVNLLGGGAATGTADTADMVRARAEFLGAGHYAALSEVLADHAAQLVADDALVLDAGAGTGYYLAAVLDRLPAAVGLALDSSTLALRRAAKAHPRAGAVACDLWHPLPVRTGTATLILNVFAPRNGPQFHRILRSDGSLLVVTPTGRHLAELVGPLGLVTVDGRKRERLSATLSPHFGLDRREEHTATLTLSHTEMAALVQMGPSARHVDADQLRQRIAQLPEEMVVTASFSVAVYRPTR